MVFRCNPPQSKRSSGASTKDAREHWAKRSKKVEAARGGGGGGGEGRGREGKAQTYRTPPNGFAPLGPTLSRHVTSGKSQRKQNRGGQLVYSNMQYFRRFSRTLRRSNKA